jgi:putative protein-disulfide isomerase
VSTHVTYLFDPLCGWCYGASPVIGRLAQHRDIRLALAPTGLFAGSGQRMDASFAEFAWSNDQRIARLTGQRFTETYRQNVLGRHGSPFDSSAMTLALTAVALTDPLREGELLKALQEARYVDGLDTGSANVVDALLRQMGLNGIADQVAAADLVLLERNASRLQQARRLMRSLGAQGVPGLVVHTASGHRLLGGSVLYGDFEQLLRQIQAA